MGTEEKEQKVESLTEMASDFLGLAEPIYDKGYADGYGDSREDHYDKGYDDGWKARDEMAGRHQKDAEKSVYDNGWIAGAQAALSRSYSHNAVDGYGPN